MFVLPPRRADRQPSGIYETEQALFAEMERKARAATPSLWRRLVQRGVRVVTPMLPARASSGSSDIGMYSPRRHSSPRSS